MNFLLKLIDSPLTPLFASRREVMSEAADCREFLAQKHVQIMAKNPEMWKKLEQSREAIIFFGRHISILDPFLLLALYSHRPIKIVMLSFISQLFPHLSQLSIPVSAQSITRRATFSGKLMKPVEWSEHLTAEQIRHLNKSVPVAGAQALGRNWN